jgi:hypothetical protein
MATFLAMAVGARGQVAQHQGSYVASPVHKTFDIPYSRAEASPSVFASALRPLVFPMFEK